MLETIHKLIISKYWNYSWFTIILLDALYLVFLGSPRLIHFITISLALILWGINLNTYFISEELEKELYNKNRVNQESLEKIYREECTKDYLEWRLWYRYYLQEKYGEGFNAYDRLKMFDKKYSTNKYLPR